MATIPVGVGVFPLKRQTGKTESSSSPAGSVPGCYRGGFFLPNENYKALARSSPLPTAPTAALANNEPGDKDRVLGGKKVIDRTTS